jgi:hypothetical protein
VPIVKNFNSWAKDTVAMPVAKTTPIAAAFIAFSDVVITFSSSFFRLGGILSHYSQLMGLRRASEPAVNLMNSFMAL